MKKLISIFVVFFVFFLSCFPGMGETLFEQETSNGTYLIHKLRIDISRKEAPAYREQIYICFLLLKKPTGTEIIARIPQYAIQDVNPIVSVFWGKDKIWIVQKTDLVGPPEAFYIAEIPRAEKGFLWDKRESVSYVESIMSPLKEQFDAFVLPGTAGIKMRDIRGHDDEDCRLVDRQPFVDLENSGIPESDVRVDFKAGTLFIEAKIDGDWQLFAEYDEKKSSWNYNSKSRKVSRLLKAKKEGFPSRSSSTAQAETSRENSESSRFWLIFFSGVVAAGVLLIVALLFSRREKA